MFTFTLDILEDYCMIRGYQFCRLDGSTELADRESQIADFSAEGSSKFIFLISTKAGGLGINLVSANHVILYDSDWNPQTDLQAMDRAYRIGQKKKVYVYRLITHQTIEEKMIERQAIKLKLDQIIIQQGKHAALSNNLSKDEYEKILLHGAAMIIEQKKQGLHDEEIDVDKIIEEGEKKFHQLRDEANTQADKIKNCFDFSYNEIDMFQFKDENYKEKREQMRQLIVDEQTKKMMQQQENFQTERAKRNAVMRSQQSMEQMSFAKETRPRKDNYEPGKTKGRLIPLVHEFQFIENFEEVKEYVEFLRQKQNEYKKITEEEQELLEKYVSTGFSKWTKSEYHKFLKGFRKYGLSDVRRITKMVETKTTEEVQDYMNVFTVRFRELKEKEEILKKLNQMSLDENTAKTIEEFDITKNYAMLL